ncbi:MAG: 6,7-dimethyl-8-ribityllumazine synthase [Eubacteriales bacterium]|nr:6,7-dimethyl-8-ribityllumazine synthase [Eubacteriales bacterium]
MNTFEGKLVAGDVKIGIVCARFNELVVGKLLSGAEDTLLRHGVKEENIDVAWCPGAFEIPLIATKMVNTGRYDAILTLGAVIRGETPHFDFVCSEAAKGVAQLELSSGVPVMFGILTTDTLEQALMRAGSKGGNKGSECASGAIEMINVIHEIEK